ncbi:hypothetical protein HWV62_38875 [Athelia sp. TMB]|nr:hypothetical protein HWV62_38875 [Athelia sp. TMB]
MDGAAKSRFLGAIYVVTLLADLINTATFTPTIVASAWYYYLPGCSYDPTRFDDWSLWVPFIVMEVVIMGFTVKKLWGHGEHSRTMRVLMRDSIVYFCIVAFEIVFKEIWGQIDFVFYVDIKV